MSRENIRACEGKFKSPSGEGSTDAAVWGGLDSTGVLPCCMVHKALFFLIGYPI